MTATDPVEEIQHVRFEHPFVTDLPAILTRLAKLPPATEARFLTLTLDWRPDGTRPNLRTGRQFFDQQVDEVPATAGFEPHTPSHESLAADVAAIRSYLQRGVDPAVEGIAFVACSANDIFEPIPLGFSLPNRFEIGPTPALRSLAALAEDEQPYLVVLSDQKHASITLVDQAARRRDTEIQGTGYPRKQMQGGWSQKRYQGRADERIEAFARTVAEEARRGMDDTDAAHLVLAGNDQTTTLLRDYLHPSVRERIAGTVHLDLRAGQQELLAATQPVVERAEREREAHAVGRLENGAGPGGGAVTGADETLTALQTGQVMTLVMNDDFAAEGWADFTLPLYGVGPAPSRHPAGGRAADLAPIDLEEELVRLALQQDAEIEIVRTRPPVTSDESVADAGRSSARTEAATRLGALGGVGAILRFALGDDQSTASL